MIGTQEVGNQRGIMSRTFEQIFEYIQTTDVNYCVVRASYLEIYNEEIKDLLNKHNPNKLVVKEHPEKGEAFLVITFLTQMTSSIYYENTFLACSDIQRTVAIFKINIK